MNFSNKRTFLFCSAALVLATIGLSIGYGLHLAQGATKYGIVVDAGSSHTSLVVFSWNRSLNICEAFSCKPAGGGFSSYTEKPELAGASLIPCLNEVLNIIPEEDRESTFIAVCATAGMRLLQHENPKLVEAIFDGVTSVLKQYNFAIREVGIITGEEEALYAWLSVNYLQRSLEVPSSSAIALDMGGASTQIAYWDPDSKSSIQLYERDYPISSYEYLCYGKNEVLTLYITSQIDDTAPPSELVDPCYPVGFEKKLSYKKLFESNPCIQRAHSFLHDGNDVLVHKGSGNYQECRKHIKRVIETNCPFQPCMKDFVQKKLKLGIVGLSLFYNTISFLQMVTRNEKSWKEDNFMTEFCRKTTNDLKAYNDKYADDVCFNGSYILVVLEDMYKFTESEIENIALRKAGWNLGYAVRATGMVSARVKHTARDIVCIVFICIFILTVVLYCIYRWYYISSKNSESAFWLQAPNANVIVEMA